MKSIFFLFLLITSHIAGPAYPACVLACIAACSAMCTVILFVPGYPGCIAVCPSSCLMTCFANDTVFIVAERNTEKFASQIVPGDTILTLEGSQQIWTTVIRNVKSTGNFEFLTIHTNSESVTVTPRHIMLTADMKMIPADNLKVGQKIATQHGSSEIVKIDSHTRTERYTIDTVHGTVLARGPEQSRENLARQISLVLSSGILSTTLCPEELKSGELSDILHDWRLRHNITKL